MRKYGQHQTSVMPKQAWNEKFSAGSTKTIMEQCDELMETKDSLIEEMENEVVGGVQLMLKQLNGETATPT